MGFSNNVCEIQSLANNQIQKIRTIDSHKKNIVNVKFGSDSNLLYTGSSDCNIKLWDLRTSSDCVLQFIGLYVVLYSPLSFNKGIIAHNTNNHSLHKI